MKNITRIIFILFLFSQYLFAQQEHPIRIYQTIGDTLRPAERDRYRLLTAIDNFRWAQFYLNPDSTTKVRVHFLANGIEQDSIISRYYLLKKLTYQCQAIDSLMALEDRDAQESLIISSPLNTDKKYTSPFRIIMNDFTFLYGRIDSARNANIFFTSAQNQRYIFNKNEIKSIDTLSMSILLNSKTVDPDESSTFILPSASMKKGGSFEVSINDLFVYMISVGVTDYISCSTGFSATERSIFFLAPKIGLYNDGNNKLAVGGFFTFDLNKSYSKDFQTVYAVYTAYDPQGSMSLGANFMFSGRGNDRPQVSLFFGCDPAFADSWKFLFSTVLLLGIDHGLFPLPGVGLRYFSNHFVWELGLAYFPVFEEFPFLPWLTFNYTF